MAYCRRQSKRALLRCGNACDLVADAAPAKARLRCRIGVDGRDFAIPSASF
jgi:hypothetical protein